MPHGAQASALAEGPGLAGQLAVGTARRCEAQEEHVPSASQPVMASALRHPGLGAQSYGMASGTTHSDSAMP